MKNRTINACVCVWGGGGGGGGAGGCVYILILTSILKLPSLKLDQNEEYLSLGVVC